MTYEQEAYIKSHPNEPMTPEVFAECIAEWKLRGCPTKANAAQRQLIQERMNEKSIRRSALQKHYYIVGKFKTT